MKLSPEWKAYFGRFGLIMLFWAGIGHLDAKANQDLVLATFVIGSLLALNLGWSKADHE